MSRFTSRRGAKFAAVFGFAALLLGCFGAAASRAEDSAQATAPQPADASITIAFAVDDGRSSGNATPCPYCPQCGKRPACSCVCDPGDYSCCPQTKIEKVTKECWNVACEPVCVPAFKWPWERCGLAKCGRVRCVNVLGQEEFECEECVTTWSVRRVRGCCPACGGSGCGCGVDEQNAVNDQARARVKPDVSDASVRPVAANLSIEPGADAPPRDVKNPSRNSVLGSAWRWLRGGG